MEEDENPPSGTLLHPCGITLVGGWSEKDRAVVFPPCPKCDKPAEKCERCGNYLAICGHDLPFKERIKSVRPNYNGWGPTK